MELVDIYNDKHEILIQQRLATAKKCPNMWETASGGAISSEDGVQGALRELEEELGIVADKNDLRFIGSYARINDFVEVFLLKKNIDINNLKFVLKIKKIIKCTKNIIICKFYDKIINTTGVIIC